MKGKRISRKNHKKYGGIAPSNKTNIVTPSSVATVDTATPSSVATVETATPSSVATVETATPSSVATVETTTPSSVATVDTTTPSSVATDTSATVDTATPSSVETDTSVTVDTDTPSGVEPETEEYSEPVVPSVFIFNTTQISTQPNTDTNYKEVGIIHVSESAAISMDPNIVVNVYNTSGAHRYDTEVFDSARNLALEKLNNQLKENHKVSNLRMELSKGPNLIFVHLYGSLLQRE